MSFSSSLCFLFEKTSTEENRIAATRKASSSSSSSSSSPNRCHTFFVVVVSKTFPPRQQQKRAFVMTGQARGLEYLKKERQLNIPENPSKQNIFGDAKRFTKGNAFLHVSKKKKKKKKKRVVSVMNASEERALKRVERLKTHVVQQQQRGNCIERRETSASFFSSWVRGRFLSAKIGRRRKGGKASLSSSSSSSSSNLLPSLPRSSTRSH